MRSNWADRVVQSISLVLLLGCCYISINWMIADFYGERVAQSIDNWRGLNSKPAVETLERHLDFSRESLEWAPNNGRYMELEARLRLMMYLEHSNSNTELERDIEYILQLHRDASFTRPNWPFSWANIVYFKSILGDYDKEFDEALKSLMTYGPYETDALQRVVYAGIRGWSKMSRSSKDNIRTAIANASEMDRRLAKNIRQRLIRGELKQEFCDSILFHSDRGRNRVCG